MFKRAAPVRISRASVASQPRRIRPDAYGGRHHVPSRDRPGRPLRLRDGGFGLAAMSFAAYLPPALLLRTDTRQRAVARFGLPILPDIAVIIAALAV